MRGTERSRCFRKAIVRTGSKTLYKRGFRCFRPSHEPMGSRPGTQHTSRKHLMNTLKHYKKLLFCAAGFLTAALVAGCGGGGDQGRDPVLGVGAATLTSVAVTPNVATVALGATQQ